MPNSSKTQPAQTEKQRALAAAKSKNWTRSTLEAFVAGSSKRAAK